MSKLWETPESQPQADVEPRIIVDDDWKSRAQAEKEALQKLKEEQQKEKGAGEKSVSPKTSDAASKTAPQEGEHAIPHELPPPTFSTLIASLATQAVSVLAPPSEDEKKDDDPQARLAFARHFIDTLTMLEEKTKGNLDADESRLLTNYLSAVRMQYVSAAKEAKNSA